MRILRRLGFVFVLLGVFGVAVFLALRLKGGGLWDGLTPAIAANNQSHTPANYDLKIGRAHV